MVPPRRIIAPRRARGRAPWRSAQELQNAVEVIARRKFEQCFGQPVPSGFAKAWTHKIRGWAAENEEVRELAYSSRQQSPKTVRRRLADFLAKKGVSLDDPLGDLKSEFTKPNAAAGEGSSFMALRPLARLLALHYWVSPEEPFDLHGEKAKRTGDRGPLSVATDTLALVIAAFDTCPVDLGPECWELEPGSAPRRYGPARLTDAMVAAVAFLISPKLAGITSADVVRGTPAGEIFRRFIRKVKKARKTHGYPPEKSSALGAAQRALIPGF